MLVITGALSELINGEISVFRGHYPGDYLVRSYRSLRLFASGLERWGRGKGGRTITQSLSPVTFQLAGFREVGLSNKLAEYSCPKTDLTGTLWRTDFNISTRGQ